MQREVAKARTRKAQMAAGALLLGAVAVVAVPAGVLSGGQADTPSEPTVARPADRSGAHAAGSNSAAVDASTEPTSMALLLEGLAPPLPPPRAKAPEVAEATGSTSAPPPPPPAPPWRFIGVVLGQSRASHRAIVVSHDQQTMVMEGQSVDGDRVDEIHDTYVLVTSAAGVQRRVDMAVPARAQLTVRAPVPAPAKAAAPVATVAEAADDSGMELDALHTDQGSEELLAQARAMGLTDDFIARYDAEALAKVLQSLQQRGPAGRLRMGENGEGMDAVQLLNRRKIQALDSAFHSGKVTAAEYKEQMARLSRQPILKGSENQEREALEELIEQELGPQKSDEQPK